MPRVTALVLLLVVLPAAAAQPDAPLTVDDLALLAGLGYDDAQIAAELRRRGGPAAVSDAALALLRTAGVGPLTRAVLRPGDPLLDRLIDGHRGGLAADALLEHVLRTPRVARPAERLRPAREAGLPAVVLVALRGEPLTVALLRALRGSGATAGQVGALGRYLGVAFELDPAGALTLVRAEIPTDWIKALRAASEVRGWQAWIEQLRPVMTRLRDSGRRVLAGTDVAGALAPLRLASSRPALRTLRSTMTNAGAQRVDLLGMELELVLTRAGHPVYYLRTFVTPRGFISCHGRALTAESGRPSTAASATIARDAPRLAAAGQQLLGLLLGPTGDKLPLVDVRRLAGALPPSVARELGSSVVRTHKGLPALRGALTGLGPVDVTVRLDDIGWLVFGEGRVAIGSLSGEFQRSNGRLGVRFERYRRAPRD